MNPTYKYIISLVFLCILMPFINKVTRVDVLYEAVLGSILWLVIISINLKYQLTQQTNQTNLKQIIVFLIACPLNLICFTLLADLTGAKFSALCVCLIALFSLIAKFNRIYFSLFAISIISIPSFIIYNSEYRFERVMRVFDGTTQATFNFLATTNISFKELGIFGEQLFLSFFSSKVGIVPAFALVVGIVVMWLYLFIVTLKLKTEHSFYRRLVLFITLFFIFQSFVHVLTNIGILHYTLLSNIMPISTNPAFWVFFVALVLCVIRINLKDKVFE